MGEPLQLERYQGGEKSGGYHVESYSDPEQVQGLLRPGDIDVPYIDTKGRHGTSDWWVIVDATDDIAEQDRFTRASVADDGTVYEVSKSRPCPIHGVEVFQADERDAGRHSATAENPDS